MTFCQIRHDDGTIYYENMTFVDVCKKLEVKGVEKISFDFDSGRLALRSDGTFQLFGGLVNFPQFLELEEK